MKQQNLYIVSYSALLLVGGVIGYFAAGSVASLVMSVLFALLLLICTMFISNGNQKAYDVAIGAVFILFLFFGYRYILSYKLMPGGLMMLISGALVAWLAIGRFAGTKST